MILSGKPSDRTRRNKNLASNSTRGNPVYTQEIPFTDFPVDEVKLYFANNDIHLPSEY